MRRQQIHARSRDTPGALRHRCRMTETLTIFVVARPLYGPIVIDERMSAIDWPYNADSSPAFFRIIVPETLPEPVLEAKVEVRLYHANLDLLDVTHLLFRVTSD